MPIHFFVHLLSFAPCAQVVGGVTAADLPPPDPDAQTLPWIPFGRNSWCVYVHLCVYVLGMGLHSGMMSPCLVLETIHEGLCLINPLLFYQFCVVISNFSL